MWIHTAATNSDNAALGLGSRDQTAHFPVFLHLRTTNLPGPDSIMRSEHNKEAVNCNLFVQIVAHIAAAAIRPSVLQYLKAGQITPLTKPTDGHRPLLMMSFLRRLALKSVTAAKRESVAKCAGPLQYGVGRPDGANTMIKTIQYLAEADTSRVPVVLDFKAAFQNVARRAMLYSIEQTDADLAAVFSKWYTGTTRSTGCTTILPTPKSVPTAGWIRVVLCQRVDFQLPLTLYSGQFWRSFAHITTQALNSLPTWTTGTCGSNHSSYCRLSLLSQ